MEINRYDMTHIDAMEGHEFENFIADLLRKLSYQNVKVTRGSGDQGVDVLAEKEGIRYAVQCKCYSSDLGNTPVQEVNTGKVIYNCHVGVVVTNRYFTSGAKEAAKATGVLLWDRVKLQELMMQTDSMAQSTSNEDALLKRGIMSLEDGEWRKANGFFEQVLNLNAECGDAYLGKVLAAVQVASLEELRKKAIRLDTFKDFSHAMQFSSGTRLQALKEVEELLQQKWQIKEETGHRQKAEKEAWTAKMAPLWKSLRKRNLIAAGIFHTVGIKADGTVIAVGSCPKPDWKDIVAVATASDSIVGLKSNGTVVATATLGDVSNWTNIIAIADGIVDTVGLKSYGTVVHSWFPDDDDDVSKWKGIVSIAAGGNHIVGLKSNGTVVATGDNDSGQCNVSRWKDVMAISARLNSTVGLKFDGTVVAVGENDCGQCKVSSWNDIVAIAAGSSHTVGLKSDGTVVAVGDNDCGQCDVSNWKNIVAISAGDLHTVGLKSDGTVVAVGDNDSGQCNVSDWKLFDSIETLAYLITGRLR